ncbi:MAG: hypothetical protein ACK5NB_00100 [Flavobacteriaceae bacterium]
MNSQDLVNVLTYTIPSIITGAVAYYFFKAFIKNEDGQRRFLLHKDMQSNTLPIRLQAYERLTLFLERLRPSKLLIRVAPLSDNKEDYETLLIQSIEQEFEHNQAQQIYVSNDCWNVIVAAKNTTIQLIRKANLSEKTDTANKLREVVLTEMLDKPAPSETALLYIKNEVGELWG